MSKNDPIESALSAISQLRAATSAEQTERQLRSYLANRSNLVVAKAANVAGELRVAQLVPELVMAFERLMKDPAKLDKRCAALTEVVAALYELDCAESEIYLRGLHHVQFEPSFGEPVDAAVALRGMSAQGLLRTRYPKRMEEVLPLLGFRGEAARREIVTGELLAAVSSMMLGGHERVERRFSAASAALFEDEAGFSRPRGCRRLKPTMPGACARRLAPPGTASRVLHFVCSCDLMVCSTVGMSTAPTYFDTILPSRPIRKLTGSPSTPP